MLKRAILILSLLYLLAAEVLCNTSFSISDSVISTNGVRTRRLEEGSFFQKAWNWVKNLFTPLDKTEGTHCDGVTMSLLHDEKETASTEGADNLSFTTTPPNSAIIEIEDAVDKLVRQVEGEVHSPFIKVQNVGVVLNDEKSDYDLSETAFALQQPEESLRQQPLSVLSGTLAAVTTPKPFFTSQEHKLERSALNKESRESLFATSLAEDFASSEMAADTVKEKAGQNANLTVKSQSHVDDDKPAHGEDLEAAVLRASPYPMAYSAINPNAALNLLPRPEAAKYLVSAQMNLASGSKKLSREIARERVEGISNIQFDNLQAQEGESLGKGALTDVSLTTAVSSGTEITFQPTKQALDLSAIIPTSDPVLKLSVDFLSQEKVLLENAESEVVASHLTPNEVHPELDQETPIDGNIKEQQIVMVEESPQSAIREALERQAEIKLKVDDVVVEKLGVAQNEHGTTTLTATPMNSIFDEAQPIIDRIKALSPIPHDTTPLSSIPINVEETSASDTSSLDLKPELSIFDLSEGLVGETLNATNMHRSATVDSILLKMATETLAQTTPKSLSEAAINARAKAQHEYVTKPQNKTEVASLPHETYSSQLESFLAPFKQHFMDANLPSHLRSYLDAHPEVLIEAYLQAYIKNQPELLPDIAAEAMSLLQPKAESLIRGASA